MSAPRVSIIMPAYNQATYIAAAIQSVLDQSYPDWELIIVDDGSTDGTAAVVAQFGDPRLHYVQQTNQGASAARNAGLAAARGAYFAFLDADDLYCPGKLAVQVAFLEQQPAVGLTYGSRIEINQHGEPVNLARLPLQASLETMVLSFPFAPSDLMVRRDWLAKAGGFRQPFVVNEDRDLYIRLALAGCHCVGVEQFLAYRRLQTDKCFRDLPARFDDMQRALTTAFGDPRCPAEVQALANLAHRNICLAWAYQAALQHEAALAERYFRAILQYDPAILADEGKQLVRFLIHAATRDGGDHDKRLRAVFAQMPAAMARVANQCEQAVAQGHLIQGARHLLWSRLAQGQRHLARGLELGAQVDEAFLKLWTQQLLNYEVAFGAAAAQTALRKLAQSLQELDLPIDLPRLQSRHAVSQAFKAYRQGHYTKAIPNALRALLHDPTYLANRGVGAILVRSLYRALGASLRYRAKADSAKE